MSVEFLTDDGTGDDPEPLPGPRRSRRWWPAAVAVLAAGAIVVAVTRREPTRTPVPAPSATVAASPSAPVAGPDPACRGVPDCAVRADVPAPLRRLARHYLPPGARLRVHSVVAVDMLTQDDLLVERDIDAVVGSVRVLIRLQRGGPATRTLAPVRPGVGSVLLHGINSGFVARLQYLAPEPVVPPVGRLRALLRDPRLVAG